MTIRGTTKSAIIRNTFGGLGKGHFGTECTGPLCETLVHRSDFGLIFNIPLESGVVGGDEVKIELYIETILKK